MAIAYDNFSSGGTGYPALTLSHTIAGANDRILVALYVCAGSTDPAVVMASATYNGVSATGSFNITANKHSNSYSITAFYWLEAQLPASAGAYNLVGTPASGFWNVADSCISYTGVNQVAPVNASNSSVAGGTGASNVNITTPADNSVIVDASLRWAVSNATMTPSSGQTKHAQIVLNPQADMGVGDEAVTTTQAYNQGWTFASEYMWMSLAYAFAPAGGAVTPQYNMLGHNF